MEVLKKRLNYRLILQVKTINIKKNGYICLTGSRRYGGYYYWKLYNKSKKLFTGLGGGIDKDNCKYVAIKKGTYYLKTDEAANIKYVFYKDPSKKNYTKKSAVKLKKNKESGFTCWHAAGNTGP